MSDEKEYKVFTMPVDEKASKRVEEFMKKVRGHKEELMKPATKTKHCKRRIGKLIQSLKESEEELWEICKIIDGERGAFSQTKWFVGKSTTHNATQSIDVAISALMRMKSVIENSEKEEEGKDHD